MWIKVTERLPEVFQEYLVCGGKSKKTVSTLNFTKEGWHSDVFDKLVDQELITHWMPLPTPPKD